MHARSANEFEQAAREDARRNLFTEFWEFFGSTKKWWMVPIVVTLFLLGALLLLSTSAAAPFIYTLF